MIIQSSLIQQKLSTQTTYYIRWDEVIDL